ncbi:MAG TPA: transglutaminase family protein, partial [Methylotenera sp.]|nr:transglutaminase family protein [Methylotenera sp.]
MLLNIEHHTRYAYSEPVNYTIQQLRLTPQNGFGQHVKRWDIRVNGELQPSADAYGNTIHTLVIDVPHEEITVIASGEVETGLDVISQHQALPLSIYLRDTPLTKSDVTISVFAKQFKRSAHLQNQALEEMMHALLVRVSYIKGVTQVTTSAIEAFKLGQGVCQDHAHIFIACCRSIGLPARYVSGYLFTEDGSLMQTHAWADVYLEADGWQSFDVSNGCRAHAVHVRLASGLDYRTASPVSGMRSGGGIEGMATSVIVNQAGMPLDKQRRINQNELVMQAESIKQAQQAQQ